MSVEELELRRRKEERLQHELELRKEELQMQRER